MKKVPNQRAYYASARSRRLPNMTILGLTGSVGMGKSTAGKMLKRLGLPLHDSDAAVHRLLGFKGGAVDEIEAAFPGVVVDGAVDRGKLGARVFGDSPALRQLENIVHPKVRIATLQFLQCHARRRTPLVVLDIPLLFETGGQDLCDAVAVVTAPRFVQTTRVMSRSGMTLERLAKIRAQQLPDQEKCRRADFVIRTGLGKADTLRQLRSMLISLRK